MKKQLKQELTFDGVIILISIILSMPFFITGYRLAACLIIIAPILGSLLKFSLVFLGKRKGYE